MSRNSRKRKVDGQTMKLPIVDLKSLQTAIVLCRPSKVIKTAYVADVINLQTFPQLDGMLQKHLLDVPSVSSPRSKKGKSSIQEFLEQCSFESVAAHAPSLDCAGMVVPGSRVWCSPSSATSKTSLVIQQCEELREDGKYTRVGYHPQLAETIIKKLLTDHLLESDLGKYDAIEQQQTYGNSRVDFVLTSNHHGAITKTLLEVKNVVGADYPCGEVPAMRSPVGVYESSKTGKKYKRAAIFPHGSHKPGIQVVSSRAIKHVHELTNLHGTSDSEGCALRSVVVFIVNRGDCEYFRPCHEADMLFAQVL